jgi:hypothetical protein
VYHDASLSIFVIDCRAPASATGTMSMKTHHPRFHRALLLLGLCAAGLPAPAPAQAAAPPSKAEITKLEAQIEGLLAPAHWVMTTGSGAIESKAVHKLCNTQSGECLGWKKQPSGTGINLSWFEPAADKQARLVKKGGGAIAYGDTVALFVGQTDDSYLCYERREFGINLTWSTKPCYQWRIDDPGAGSELRTLRVGDPFVLFNLTENDTLVRCARSKQAFQGAWLKWGKTCSKAELAYTNKSLFEALTKKLSALGG